MQKQRTSSCNCTIREEPPNRVIQRSAFEATGSRKDDNRSHHHRNAARRLFQIYASSHVPLKRLLDRIRTVPVLHHPFGADTSGAIGFLPSSIQVDRTGCGSPFIWSQNRRCPGKSTSPYRWIWQDSIRWFYPALPTKRNTLALHEGDFRPGCNSIERTNPIVRPALRLGRHNQCQCQLPRRR
jgi:hypothetical protein